MMPFCVPVILYVHAMIDVSKICNAPPAPAKMVLSIHILNASSFGTNGAKSQFIKTTCSKSKCHAEHSCSSFLFAHHTVKTNELVMCPSAGIRKGSQLLTL